MNGFKIVVLFFAFMQFFSCKQNSDIEKIQVKKINVIKSKQDFNKVFPDFIHLKDEYFNTYKNSKDRNWFISNNEKLFLIPHTDYSISTLILTNIEIKDSFINELLKNEKIFSNDISKAISISEIKTDKNIYLGISKSEIEKVYGMPNQQNSTENMVKCFWNFKMLDNRKDYKWSNLKPFVSEDLKFNVELHFINDKLVTLIYSYEVP